MISYLVRRLLYLIPVIVLVSAVVFSFLHLAGGDPAQAMLGDNADPQLLAIVRRDLGLDLPLHEQYWTWISRAARGDLGRSILPSRLLVGDVVAQRLPVTAQLGVFGMCLAIAVGLPLGVLAGARRGSKLDAIATSVSVVGIALPSFLLALILILVFALWLRWLPPSGYVPPDRDLARNLQLMVLPSVTMAAFLLAFVVRITRTSIMDTMEREFVNTARAKGLSERAVVTRHALKAALIPVVTIIGLQLGTVLGGSIIIESIFAIPGLGKLTIDAIDSRDLPMLQGATLVLSVGFVLANIVVDFAYAYLDPRIHFGRS